MELKQYLQIPLRWWWILVLGLIIGVSAGYYSSSRQIPFYSASTKVMVSQAPDSNSQYYYSTVFYDQQLAETYIQLLTTQPILSSVGEKLGYSVSAGQVSAQLIENTSLFRLTIRDSDPIRAADIANTLVSELVIQNERLQNTRYTSVEESLQAQLAQVETQISTLQDQITNISEESLASQQDKVKVEIDQLEAQILQIQKEINQLQPQVQNEALQDPTLSPSNQSLLQEKQLKLDQLQSSLDFYHSIYLNLVAAGISGTTSSATANQSSQLQSALNLYTQMHNNLLNSYETIRLARLQNTPNVVQIEMAAPNPYPINPQPRNSAMLGAAVGLMLAAGIVFLIEYLDDTIKSPEDITERFDLPIIGYIAEMTKSLTGEGNVYVVKEPLSPVTEAFRSLRTGIEYSDLENPPKTIMVASANASEGKTTVAVNLAIVFAQSGKNVVIVDADLRRPMIHRYFGLSNRIGLSDLILESVTIKAVEHPWKDSNLSIITSGRSLPNPSELLASDNMVKIIEELNFRNHISIIDSPPFLVSDATLLAAKVDGVILVVQPGKTTKSSLRASLEQLERVDAKILGIVFNRIPRNRGYYYGGYKGYSNYYSKGYKNYYENNSGRNGKNPVHRKVRKVIDHTIVSDDK